MIFWRRYRTLSNHPISIISFIRTRFNALSKSRHPCNLDQIFPSPILQLLLLRLNLLGELRPIHKFIVLATLIGIVSYVFKEIFGYGRVGEGIFATSAALVIRRRGRKFSILHLVRSSNSPSAWAHR